MKKYRRNHFLTVIDNTLSIFIKGFLPFILIVFSKFRHEILSLNNTIIKVSIFLGIILIAFIFSILQWYNRKYYIYDKKITVHEGIFVSKHREIPFNKIQTINTSQSIKQRILGLASIKIDTGNSSINDSEVNIVIANKMAQQFKDEILSIKYDDENISQIYEPNNKEHNTMRISNKELLIASLTKGSWFSGIAIILGAFSLLDDYLNDILKNVVNDAAKYVQGLEFKTMSVSQIVIITATIILLYLVFSFTVAIIKTFIKFYDFTLKREGKNLIISYGLFEKKSYSISVNKISAVYINQSLIRQLTGHREMQIESVGYGDENGESSILFPIASFQKQQYIINKFLPEFYFEDQLVKVPKRSLIRFIISSIIYVLIPLIILALKFKYGYFGLLLIPILGIRGYMEYKNSGILKNDRLVCLSSRGFKKQVSIIPLKRVQSIKFIQNYFQEQSRVFNFEISIQGNIFGQTIGVKNLSSDLISMLRREVVQ